MIIGVGYKKQVGKDAFIKIVQENFPEIKSQRIAFADPLKHMVWENLFKDYGFSIDIFDDPITKPLLRPMNTSYGGFMRDYVDVNFWRDKALEKLDYNILNMFSDLRHPNEFEKIKELGGYTVKINRSSTDDGNQDYSENALNDYEFDYVLDNNGTYEEYEEKVIDLVKNLYNIK